MHFSNDPDHFSISTSISTLDKIESPFQGIFYKKYQYQSWECIWSYIKQLSFSPGTNELVFICYESNKNNTSFMSCLFTVGSRRRQHWQQERERASSSCHRCLLAAAQTGRVLRRPNVGSDSYQGGHRDSEGGVGQPRDGEPTCSVAWFQQVWVHQDSKATSTDE